MAINYTRKDCFAYNEKSNTCDALKYLECKARGLCSFYKTVDQINADWKKTQARLFDITRCKTQVNEFDTEEKSTANYKSHKEIMSNISIALIADVHNYMCESCIHKEDSKFDKLEKQLLKIMKECVTEQKCPKCGANMYKSDLPQYDHICVQCDENF